MTQVEDSLIRLRDETWTLAAQCRDAGDMESFRTLVDFNERLANLIRTRQHHSGANTHSDLIRIFSPDRKHVAQLDPARWTKRRGSKCVLIGGTWTTLSSAAATINGYQTRGPEWWHYDDDGQLKPVSLLKPKLA